MDTKTHASILTYRSQTQRLQTEEYDINFRISRLQSEHMPIRTITMQSNQRHLLCPKDPKFLQWLLQNDEYIQIVNNKIPDKEHIIRRCSFEPHSKLSILPLTPYNLSLFSKEVGLHDSSLLQIILTLSKGPQPSHRPQEDLPSSSHRDPQEQDSCLK